MSFNLYGLTTQTRSVTQSVGGFDVLEYERDPSVSHFNAQNEYFMGKMHVRKRQVVANLAGDGRDLITQAGAMQVILGSVEATTDIKGAGRLLKSMARGMVTSESAIKPRYTGTGTVILEPTYKFNLLHDLKANWGGGVVVEDGMFLASMGNVESKAVMRSNVSSAVAGGEGLFSLGLYGDGVVALESPVPQEELITIDLDNDVVKIDGSMAVAWSPSLQFTVERTTKSLIGSAASGEGLVNVYRGTGRVLMCPTSPTGPIAAALLSSGE